MTTVTSQALEPPPSVAGESRYQRHVDGLRAVAVLLVVFYHFGSAWFPGGYIGVDVFFVISGYLITRLILDEIHRRDAFDFKRFYIRRMRRLFPALFATLVLSLGLAIALFSPEQFQRFGRSLAAAAFSGSNILFWTESGYFDVDAHLKPLLHTWSLGVEEQFYLFWPAYLWLVARITPRRWHPLMLALTGAVSLLLNHVWVAGHFDPKFRSAIFFLTPFRMFELCLGAMALQIDARPLPGRGVYEAAMAAGLVLIGYSAVTYSDTLIFPYYWALVPCVGAFLVIVSGRARVVGALLTNRVSVGIGLISYSMYLLHWPALVFYEHYRFEPLTTREYIAGFGVVTLASALMYRFIETPYRRHAPTTAAPTRQRPFVLSSVAATLALGLIGVQIALSSGWVWRDRRALTATAVAAGKQRRFELFNAGCLIWNLKDPKTCKIDRPTQILFLGDSHEPDGYNSFAAIYGRSPDVNLIGFGAFNGCDVQIGPSGPFSNVESCKGRLAAVTDPQFAASLGGVVFSQNRPFHESALVIWQVIGHLKKLNPGLPVAVISGFLITNRDCSELFAEFHTFSACRDPKFVAWSAFNERHSWQPPGDLRNLSYVYIDRMRLMCSDGSLGSCTIEVNGEPAFYDSHHLSMSYAQYVGRRAAAVYGRELTAAGFPPPSVR